MTEADKIEALVDYGKSMLVLGMLGDTTTAGDEIRARDTAARVFIALVGRRLRVDEVSDLVVE